MSMKPKFQTAWLVFALLLVFLSVGGCTGDVEDIATEPTPTSEPEIPAGVIQARESALNFLREGVNCIIPPEGVLWHTGAADDEITVGASVYRFTTGDCAMTVSAPDPLPETPVYYVALRNADSDFCWQAFVDAAGHVTATSYEQIEPEFVNPAEAFCERQGGVFELRTREDGMLCGACVLDSETVCNAWDFFYGECPAESPE
jgi:putative hemolysin